MVKQIQWFPGHMAKTLREFQTIKTDVYFILLDARAPESTFLDIFHTIVKDKKVILLITKSDLVDQQELNKWIKYYKETFEYVFTISLKNIKSSQNKIKDILNNISFKSLLPKIMILGIPNVGKSTLLNILAGKAKSKVENRPGVTKQNNWYQLANKYWILDTPGVLQPKFINNEQGVKLAAIGSIKIDILPLEEVSLGLISILINKGVLDADNPNSYLNDLKNKSLKQNEIVYKKFIKDFQNNKFGKIILD